MGVRINVYLSHDLTPWHDFDRTVSQLQQSLPALLAVQAYWNLIDPPTAPVGSILTWEPEPIHERLPQIREYRGPGFIRVQVTDAAARIATGGRFSGFLRIPELREVHLLAFKAIAECLGSRSMAICSDARDEANDAFLAGGSRQDCIDALKKELGPPLHTFDSPELARAVKENKPVWFVIKLVT